MNTEIKSDKLNEYKQRHKEWRDISVAQLSNVNNIFITLSTGLLALGLSSCENKNNFTCMEKISFILLTISTCYGIAVLFSRIFDFRISRHLALTRQRFYYKHEVKLPDEYLGKSDYTDRIEAFWKIIFREIDFINKDEIETKPTQDTKNRFNKLRKKADILGNATWIWTKYQVFFFLLSAIIYLINQLIKFN